MILFSCNNKLTSLAGLIQAHKTEFGDKYVANFASFLLVLIFQPIEKTPCFSSERGDNWSGYDVNVYCELDSFWVISLKFSGNPIHQGSQNFDPNICKKLSLFFSFSLKHGVRIFQKTWLNNPIENQK